ncbi:glutaminyl-peptide cyclotransferase [Flavobacterium sp. SM2513]|uniref:glutaminyl-peptide cyclotransferase n=1 Tax=Flavobacterium sp. SM2513 TaxID=3424766 RepID=UPI003D7F3327
MRKHKVFAFIILGSLLVSCNGSKKGKTNSFSFNQKELKAQYTSKDALKLQIDNSQSKKIDSIVYFVNDTKVGSKMDDSIFEYRWDNQKLGYIGIKAVVYAEGESQETVSRVEMISAIQPKSLTYKILNVYPHDIKAYTQGLEFYRDTLFESTGNGAGNGTGIKGISSLRKTDYTTGKVYKKVDLENAMFGEGITVLNNKVYQLTYKEMTAFVYDADNFKRLKSFPYFKPKLEGWGLTNDGTNLYMSDGSEKIWTINPETFTDIDYINIYMGANKVKNVNELEWVDGKIFGNVYQKDAIARINPKTGEVEAVLNLKDLKSKVTQHPDLDVLNGIAYNPKTKTFFVTGKNWDKMFEISISE